MFIPLVTMNQANIFKDEVKNRLEIIKIVSFPRILRMWMIFVLIYINALVILKGKNSIQKL